MVISDLLLRPTSAAPARFAGALILLAGSADRYWHSFRELLRCDGAEFVTVGSGKGAIELLRRSTFDLVVLDAGMPDVSGITVLTEARRMGDVPVIVMNEGGPAVRAQSFDLGADDVVGRDIDPIEIARRVEALLRRCRPQAPAAVAPYGLEVNRSAREASINGVRLDLTATEFSVLRLLLDRRGEILSADMISREIWHYETFGSPNFVQAQISRLRAKLERGGASGLIRTLRGAGYVIR